MTDFYQNGLICTLQKLRERSLDEMEIDLRKYCAQQKAVLLLPALVSEFEKESMHGIIEQLKGADYLHRIILSLDRASEEQFRHVKELMSVLPVDVKILWNDGPGIQSILDELCQADFMVAEQGKGRGVWMSMGYALADKEVYAMALHDCDIVDYSREILVRLLYPIAHPGTDFEYSKGFYARADGQLWGRVTRLFYTPFIRALQRLRPDGAERYLHYMDSFRYPLSGEFALIRSLAKGIRISPGWGLEVSLLSEVFDNTTVERVCQVEVTESYEHKHQDLSRDEPSKGLAGMTTDIAHTLFRILAQGGVVLSNPFFRTLLATYSTESRRAIEKYHALALINGLPYDRHEEIEAVEVYTQALRRAGEAFREDPLGAPLMSAWVRVRAGLPELPARLRQVVEDDNA